MSEEEVWRDLWDKKSDHAGTTVHGIYAASPGRRYQNEKKKSVVQTLRPSSPAGSIEHKSTSIRILIPLLALLPRLSTRTDFSMRK